MVTTQHLTARDLWNIQNDSEDFELIEGVLWPREYPDVAHGIVQAQLGSLLLEHVDERQTGKAFGRVGVLLATNPDTVIAPSLAYIQAARLPDDLTGFLSLAPDLAVEIVTPGNSPGEIERKIAIYLQAGTRMIWVVYPRQRQVVVHTPGEAPRVFAESDDLPGDDVLPGLVLSLAGLFG
jgi:Uma2 family endonuclease